jgi:hypothetical protein
LLFPDRLRGFLADAGPRLLAFPGSSSRELVPLFRVRPTVTCTSLSRCAPSLGFLPPSRHQPGESTTRQASQSCLCSALSVSHALDGLLLTEPCGFVSSRSRVRGSLLRGFPRRSAVLAHHQPLPSCRYRRAPAPSKLVAPARAVRLQGFAPIAGPLSPTSCLDSPTPVPLSSFHSLRFFSEHLGSAFALPPLMTFPASSSQ